MATIFAIGDAVRLVRLVSDSSLNGVIGTIVGDNNYESRGTYAVGLQSPAAAVTAHPSDISLSPKNLTRVIECARSGCDEIGTKGCSRCLKDFYCSAVCQK